MKKVLFASTALVLSAGVAAAEVKVGGDGRMGVIDGFGASDLAFTSRLRISFAASGETDGGLTFGGSMRIDQEDELGQRASNGTAGSVFVQGAFGKLSMGDVDSAAEKSTGDVSGVGLTGLGDYNETSFLTSNDNDPSALYEYTAGDLSFYLSANQPSGPQGYSVGVKYAAANYTAGIGYENMEVVGAADQNQITVGGSASFGDATAKAVYATRDTGAANNADQWGLSLDYTMGATTATVFYTDQTDLAGDYKALGVGASYDLGGGAALKGGYVRREDAAGVDEDAFDFGISMSF